MTAHIVAECIRKISSFTAYETGTLYKAQENSHHALYCGAADGDAEQLNGITAKKKSATWAYEECYPSLHAGVCNVGRELAEVVNDPF